MSGLSRTEQMSTWCTSCVFPLRCSPLPHCIPGSLPASREVLREDRADAHLRSTGGRLPATPNKSMDAPSILVTQAAPPRRLPLFDDLDPPLPQPLDPALVLPPAYTPLEVRKRPDHLEAARLVGIAGDGRDAQEDRRQAAFEDLPCEQRGGRGEQTPAR